MKKAGKSRQRPSPPSLPCLPEIPARCPFMLIFRGAGAAAWAMRARAGSHDRAARRRTFWMRFMAMALVYFVAKARKSLVAARVRQGGKRGSSCGNFSTAAKSNRRVLRSRLFAPSNAPNVRNLLKKVSNLSHQRAWALSGSKTVPRDARFI